MKKFLIFISAILFAVVVFFSFYGVNSPNFVTLNWQNTKLSNGDSAKIYIFEDDENFENDLDFWKILAEEISANRVENND